MGNYLRSSDSVGVGSDIPGNSRDDRLAALIDLYRHTPELMKTLAQLMEVADALEAELNAKMSDQPDTVN